MNPIITVLPPEVRKLVLSRRIVGVLSTLNLQVGFADTRWRDIWCRVWYISSRAGFSFGLKGVYGLGYLGSSLLTKLLSSESRLRENLPVGL